MVTERTQLAVLDRSQTAGGSFDSLDEAFRALIRLALPFRREQQIEDWLHAREERIESWLTNWEDAA
jgi:hypothetical protein